MDGEVREVCLLLPWGIESPEDWACAIEVEGCVLEVVAQSFPLLGSELVHVTDLTPYLRDGG